MAAMIALILPTFAGRPGVTDNHPLYRVFFLPGTLQVDLAFVPRTEFRPLGHVQSSFRRSKLCKTVPAASLGLPCSALPLPRGIAAGFRTVALPKFL